jgi:hypothetical protein
MSRACLRLAALARQAPPTSPAALLRCISSATSTSSGQDRRRPGGAELAAAVAAGLAAATGLHLYSVPQPADCRAADPPKGAAAAGDKTAGAAKPTAAGSAVSSPQQLPEFSREEVARHHTKEDRIWVTYKDGVYDVTDWVEVSAQPGPALAACVCVCVCVGGWVGCVCVGGGGASRENTLRLPGRRCPRLAAPHSSSACSAAYASS